MGVHLGSMVMGGKEVDSCSLIDTVNVVENNLNIKGNKYNTTYLADSGYDSNNNSNYLANKGYKYIIKRNRRNTLNKIKLKSYKFTKKQEKIYKKRLIVESFNSWFKNFRMLDQNYSKMVQSYYGLFLCAAFNTPIIKHLPILS